MYNYHCILSIHHFNDLGLIDVKAGEGGGQAGGMGGGAAAESQFADGIVSIHAAFGKYDGPHLCDCLVEDIVDQGVLVVPDAAEFVAGLREAGFDDLFGGHVLGFAAVAQAHLKDFGAGGEDEDRDGIRKLLHDLQGALYVDVQEEVFADGAGVLEGGECGAVVVAEDFGPLQEFTAGDHLFEGLALGEVVFAAVLFRSPGCAGGVGDGEVETFDEGAQLRHQGRLARARWGGDDEEDSSHDLLEV
jgi:hypothetical protein